MNRSTAISILGLILIIAGIGVWFGTRPQSARAPTGMQPTASSSPFSVTPYVEQTAYAQIAANFPTTTPLSASAGAQANAAALSTMQDWVKQTVAQFKSDTGLADMTSAKAAQMGISSTTKLTLNIKYLIDTSQNTLSYIFTIDTYTGGVHAMQDFKTFTFNTQTGSLLSLGDIFKPGSDYLATLSQQTRAKLPGVIGTGYDFNTIKDGTTPQAKNFQNWTFDGASLMLLFPPYQVAAYAAGPQTVRIPKAQLLDVLKTDYH